MLPWINVTLCNIIIFKTFKKANSTLPTKDLEIKRYLFNSYQFKAAVEI